MPLQALGYVGFGSSALDDWRQFGTGLVGLQAVERSASLLAFRMDDRKQRIVIDRSMAEGERFFGWEVADATALDGLAARLESAGIEVIAEARRTHPHLPVILATGYADIDIAEVPVDDYAVLRKPFQISELNAAVKAALARART